MSRSSELMERARELLTSRLCDVSLRHCERTALTAAELATRFDVDSDKAGLAGLLHDYARDEDAAALLAAAADLEVPVTAYERENTYLLHARVGCAMVRRDLPGCGEAVLSAIEVHTVGAVPMSGLDKVVYIADKIEPARAFPGVDALRTACEREDLDECFRLTYGASLRHVMQKGRRPHPISAAVSSIIERDTGRPLFDSPEVRT